MIDFIVLKWAFFSFQTSVCIFLSFFFLCFCQIRCHFGPLLVEVMFK